MERPNLPVQSARSSFNKLAADIVASGVVLPAHKWDELKSVCREVQFAARETIFESISTARHILFIASGICAAQFTLSDGQQRIMRFCTKGSVCTSVGVLYPSPTSPERHDAVVAVSDVEGLLIPFDYWQEHFFNGQEFGRYARKKIFQNHLHDIDLIRIKTLNRTMESFQFLKTHQPCVLRHATRKMISQFLGITPEGFSRFLKSNPQLSTFVDE